MLYGKLDVKLDDLDIVLDEIGTEAETCPQCDSELSYIAGNAYCAVCGQEIETWENV